jgi:starvation-inducible outer membrane lipoprotein
MLRPVLFIGLALILSGCVAPKKIQQERADQAMFGAQLRDREANDRCSETAMPGTPQHLACRLAKPGASP